MSLNTATGPGAHAARPKPRPSTPVLCGLFLRISRPRAARRARGSQRGPRFAFLLGWGPAQPSPAHRRGALPAEIGNLASRPASCPPTILWLQAETCTPPPTLRSCNDCSARWRPAPLHCASLHRGGRRITPAAHTPMLLSPVQPPLLRLWSALPTPGCTAAA